MTKDQAKVCWEQYVCKHDASLQLSNYPKYCFVFFPTKNRFSELPQANFKNQSLVMAPGMFFLYCVTKLAPRTNRNHGGNENTNLGHDGFSFGNGTITLTILRLLLLNTHI